MITGKIPQKYIDFAKSIVETAKEAGCQTIDFKFRPGFPNTDWRDEIHVSWNRGRHNEPAQVCVQSQQYENFEV
jgi:hypothetical protein